MSRFMDMEASDRGITHGLEEDDSTHSTKKRKFSEPDSSVAMSVKKADVRAIQDSVTFQPEWEIELKVCDIAWDKQECVWWLRTWEGGLYKYSMDGILVARVRQGILNDWGYICIDTKRDLLVTTDEYRKVVCLTRSGEMVKEIPVSGYGNLRGITYCPHRDVYVVCDIRKQCLWFIDSDSGQVVQKLTTEASGGIQPFRCPAFIHREPVDNLMCHIVISDVWGDSVKVFSHNGEFIRKYGSMVSGDGQLQYPSGIGVIDNGRVVVCDRNNKRVVCYWWDEGEKWEVLLTEQQLGGEKPWSLAMSPDGRHLVVGMESPGVKAFTCQPV